MPASRYFYSSDRNLQNSLTFQQVPVIVLKIVWGVSLWSCVMVATLTLWFIREKMILDEINYYNFIFFQI